jgi:hypothetical protein
MVKVSDDDGRTNNNNNIGCEREIGRVKVNSEAEG